MRIKSYQKSQKDSKKILVKSGTKEKKIFKSILKELEENKFSAHKIEHFVKEKKSAVKIRRAFYKELEIDGIDRIPFLDFDYESIFGRNCENVIGYCAVPIGLVGPLKIDDLYYHIPFSTSEGALVASSNRGCKILNKNGGVTSALIDDGMTRGPAVCFPNLKRAVEFKGWIEKNFKKISSVFNSVSGHACLISIFTKIVGKLVYIRFKASTGDAMGMNMVSRGSQKTIEFFRDTFADMEIVAVSANFCSDKKVAGVNWVLGRGKSVCVEATICKEDVESILGTSVDRLVETNFRKCFIGSSISGGIGTGSNSHAANIVAAIFLATGQDLAQIVSSSSCLTVMEKNMDGNLYISVTMPSLEVATVGGGTGLASQKAAINMMGINKRFQEGERSAALARIICSAVLAGELSLLASICNNTLVSSHSKLNSHNKIKE